MSAVKIMGLDIATRTGWCRWDGRQYVTGVLDCSPESSDEPEGMRFVRYRHGLHYLLSDVDACVIERTYSRGKRTAEILNGLTSIALAELEERGIEYAFVDATRLKKAATGNGRASKDEMIAAARVLIGRTVSHDEADAALLVGYWQEHMHPRSS